MGKTRGFLTHQEISDHLPDDVADACPQLADAGKGRISQTDESAFEVGRNLAITPGDVVYENELIQLIQYKATSPQVARRPLVMIPPPQ